MRRYDSIAVHHVKQIAVSRQKSGEGAVWREVEIHFPDGSTTVIFCHGEDIEVQVDEQV